MIFFLAVLIGVVAGLRSMTAPAATSWAAHTGKITLAGTPLSFFGAPAAFYVFAVLALGELVGDKLPMTPSRKKPGPFVGRIVSGAACGAALGAAHDVMGVGLVCGAIGAVGGTMGGAAVRASLAKVFGKDLPAALLEDVVAVVSALVICNAA